MLDLRKDKLMNDCDFKVSRLLRVCLCEGNQGVLDAVHCKQTDTYQEWLVNEKKDELTYFLDFIEKIAKDDLRIVILPTWG